MIESWIAAAAQRIGEGMAAKRVWVFGSRATGRQSRRSDLDLFIECDTPMRPLDRIGRALDLAGALPCALDAIVYTPDEISRLTHSKFLRRILAEGVVAYERR
jgi:predicted nucleotidyltransferase